MTGIGAIIVTYNSEAEIGACLDAALARTDRVVVVDNASGDRTLEIVRARPGVLVVANRENRGFAAAVNQGAAALGTPLLLWLNPDAVLETGLEPLAEACGQPGTGAAAGRLIGRDGRPQAGFSIRRFPTPAALAFEVVGLNRIWRRNPVNRRYRCLDMDLDAPAEAEQPAGAFLLVRRDVFERLGGLDEGFRPAWFEDVDFLRRLRSAGYRVRYVPAAAARHLGGASAGRLPEGSRVLWWYGSLLRYSGKHFGPAGRAAVGGAVVCGCALRMAIGLLLKWKKAPVTVYGRVIRLACLGLISGRSGKAGARPALARQ